LLLRRIGRERRSRETGTERERPSQFKALREDGHDVSAAAFELSYETLVVIF
jgi:hypothetical protein